MVWAAVPVAAIAEDGYLRPRKNYVGPALELGDRAKVDPIANPRR